MLQLRYVNTHLAQFSSKSLIIGETMPSVTLPVDSGAGHFVFEEGVFDKRFILAAKCIR